MRTTTRDPMPPPSLLAVLDDWVAEGLITSDQSTAIKQHEARTAARHTGLAAPPPAEIGPSLTVEALGYLGGVVMLAGAGILAGMYWADLSTTVRLVLLGGTAAALVGAGFAVTDALGAAARRLRSVLWALGVAVTSGFLGVLTSEALDRHDEHGLVVVGLGTAAIAWPLWWRERTWLQQVALFVPSLLAAAGVTVELTSASSSWVGAAMWALAVGWAGLSWAGMLEPRTTGVAFGALGAVVGATTMDRDVGIALALATAVATVALALHERSLPWLGVAAVTLLWSMPRAADAWFPGRLSAALTLLVTGGALVGAAVWVARHQGARQESTPIGGRPA